MHIVIYFYTVWIINVESLATIRNICYPIPGFKFTQPFSMPAVIRHLCLYILIFSKTVPRAPEIMVLFRNVKYLIYLLILHKTIQKIPKLHIKQLIYNWVNNTAINC